MRDVRPFLNQFLNNKHLKYFLHGTSRVQSYLLRVVTKIAAKAVNQVN